MLGIEKCLHFLAVLIVKRHDYILQQADKKPSYKLCFND